MSTSSPRHRRTFLKQSFQLVTSYAVLKPLAGITSLFGGTRPANGPFVQAPLPYPFAALEPAIDARTMEIHYTKHAAGYTKNLNEAVMAERATGRTLEELLADVSKYPAKLRNNAGGHYNHELFWKCLREPRSANAPEGPLRDALIQRFGSWDAFRTSFTAAGKSVFGSGWVWLYRDPARILQIGTTPNQDNPLMKLPAPAIQGTPLLCLDVWEHAYYLTYQNRRADYIENWWSLVNWDQVATRL